MKRTLGHGSAKTVASTSKKGNVPKLQFLARLQVIMVAVTFAWCLSWMWFTSKWLPDDEPTWSSNPRRHNDVMEASSWRVQEVPFLPLTAYLEEEQPVDKNSRPLPLRTQGPEALVRVTYSDIQTCDDVPNKLPVFHSQAENDRFGPNVHNQQPLFDKRWEYANHTCPVDADPFLPWLHDVFPSDDGRLIHFIAHNKRRCNTNPKVFHNDLQNLEPQVALMQPVPIVQITEQDLRSMTQIPNALWATASMSVDKETNAKQQHYPTRYRLATSFQEATVNETRFICQFHTLEWFSDPGRADNRRIVKKVLGESLSVYPYNYELANLRKPGSKPMLTRPADEDDKHGAHNEQVWNSILHFSCPVPDHLQSLVASGESVDKSNGRPSLFLDLVPIRTNPRLQRDGFIPNQPSSFDPMQEWGTNHVLPTVESSGRWSHVPICLPPSHQSKNGGSRLSKKQSPQIIHSVSEEEGTPKQHFLIGCIWAAAAYTTRSGATTDTSTSERLLEWLTYHLEIAGFDHIYVYDNSGAHHPGTTTTTTTSNKTMENLQTLEPITNLFPGKVSRIPWSHRVCNNNGPGNPNSGERSSQYAAEASCRVRYGPTAEWMIAFDGDEYLIPQGKWDSIQQWLKEGVGRNSKSHILSFFQTRALPQVDHMEAYLGGKSCGESAKCLSKRSNVTFLQAYDCEATTLPKPNWAWRAMKQIYRPYYVLNHYVHYSTVTKRIVDSPDEVSPMFIEKKPYERRVDELHEAFMLHTKTTSPEATRRWNDLCHSKNANNPRKKCPVGIAFPLGSLPSTNVTKDGLQYNCYQHGRVGELVPKLEKAVSLLKQRL